jgi:hypothetical protein
MNIKVVTCRRLLAKVARVLKPNTNNWLDEAVESIGDGLKIIGYSAGYEGVCEEVLIEDSRGLLPCHIEDLEAIFYNGKLLPPLDSLSVTNGLYYRLNRSFINTSFREGKVTVYYIRLPIDEEGFPLIPDNSLVDEALMWWIARNLCLGGLKHPSIDFKMCEQLWDKYYPKAQNNVAFPSMANIEKYARDWNRLIKTNNYRQKFVLGVNDTFTSKPLITTADNKRRLIHIDSDNRNIIDDSFQP